MKGKSANLKMIPTRKGELGSGMHLKILLRIKLSTAPSIFSRTYDDLLGYEKVVVLNANQ